MNPSAVELKADTEEDSSSSLKAITKPSGVELTNDITEVEDCSTTTGSTWGPLLVVAMVAMVVVVAMVAGCSEELEGPAMAKTKPSGDELWWEAEEMG